MLVNSLANECKEQRGCLMELLMSTGFSCYLHPAKAHHLLAVREWEVKSSPNTVLSHFLDPWGTHSRSWDLGKKCRCRA